MANEYISVKRYGERETKRYDVSPDQIKRLKISSGDIGLDFQIGQFLLTMAFSFLASLLLSTVTGTPKIVFVCLVVLGFLFSPIFLYKWFRGRGEFARVIKEIEEQPELGPLGDQSRQLQPAELTSLPLESNVAAQVTTLRALQAAVGTASVNTESSPSEEK
jgi:hypothetical protein